MSGWFVFSATNSLHLFSLAGTENALSLENKYGILAVILSKNSSFWEKKKCTTNSLLALSKEGISVHVVSVQTMSLKFEYGHFLGTSLIGHKFHRTEMCNSKLSLSGALQERGLVMSRQAETHRARSLFPVWVGKIYIATPPPPPWRSERTPCFTGTDLLPCNPYLVKKRQGELVHDNPSTVREKTDQLWSFIFLYCIQTYTSKHVNTCTRTYAPNIATLRCT